MADRGVFLNNSWLRWVGSPDHPMALFRLLCDHAGYRVTQLPMTVPAFVVEHRRDGGRCTLETLAVWEPSKGRWNPRAMDPAKADLPPLVLASLQAAVGCA
jgi:hypothetical protein